MSPESSKYTAFACSRGPMEYVRMPFGLVTASATYMRLMRLMLNDLGNVSFYFDNILVHSKTWDEHVSSVKCLFSRLRQYGLTVEPSKCKMGHRKISYVGYIIGEFLGMVSFYRKFIPNAASLSASLSDILKDRSKDYYLGRSCRKCIYIDSIFSF